MRTHTLTREQPVAADVDTCWRFFSDPRNLARITPPRLDFTILGDLPPEIYPGLMIEYRVRPLFGLRVPWLTEITHVERGRYFCDEQRIGPYALWHHEHFFESDGAGGVLMRDIVHYSLPFSPVSEFLHPLVVEPQLREIFDFRTGAVGRIFPVSS